MISKSLNLAETSMRKAITFAILYIMRCVKKQYLKLHTNCVRLRLMNCLLFMAYIYEIWASYLKLYVLYNLYRPSLDVLEIGMLSSPAYISKSGWQDPAQHQC